MKTAGQSGVKQLTRHELRYVRRHQYFLHLKRNFLKKELVAPTDKQCELLAFLAQASFGDHEGEGSRCQCRSPELVDEWTSEFGRDVAREHEKLRGLRPNTAEYYFIKELSTLEDYAVEYHPAKDTAGNVLNIGVGSQELRIFDSEHILLDRYSTS